MSKVSSIYYFCVLFGSLVCRFVYGQAPEEPVFKREVPPSPNSAAFQKYGDYPVVLNTGTIPIDIPLYNINTGKIQVPISLSYHASGIRVSQLPSSVGLGWSLNAGGVVSRTMRGVPDEKGTLGYFELAATMKPAAQYTDTQADREFLFGVVNGETDASPDKFYISAPGINAQFMYDNNLEPQVYPFQQIKIEGSLTYNQEHIIITNTDGTIYRFGKSLAGTSTREVTVVKVKGVDPDPYVSSWYLTEIISGDHSDTVFFEYDTYKIANYVVTADQQFNHAFGYEGSLPDGAAQDYVSEFGHSSYLNQVYRFDEPGTVNFTAQSIQNAQSVRLIRYKGGKVEFINEEHVVGSRRVSQIIIYEDVAGYLEIKRYHFDYGIFNDQERRLKLVGVKEGTGNAFLPPYQFEYKETNSLPIYRSPNCDMWGYYNGANNEDWSTNTVNWIPSHTVNGQSFGSANRNVNPTYTDTYMLKKIVYPLKGSTTFEFEPHKIDETVIGGGLRLTRLTNFDHLGNVTSTKTYVYDGEYWVRGTMVDNYTIPHSVVEKYTICNIAFCFDVYYTWDYQTRHYNSSYYNAPSGSPISYSKVIEYLGESSSNAGKTEYEFWNIQDYGQTYGYPFPDLHDNSELRSKLLKKSEFVSLGGGQYKKVHELVNNYTLHEVNDVSGLKVKWKSKPHKMLEYFVYFLEGNPPPHPISAYLDIYDEFQKVNFVQLNSTVEVDSVVTRTTYYSYENKPDYYQVTAVETANSDGLVTSQAFKYATDRSEITELTVGELDALEGMETRNIINVPVETKVFKAGVLDTKTTTLYKLDNSVPIPKSHITEFPAGEKAHVDLTFEPHYKLAEIKPVHNISQAQIWEFPVNKPVAFIEGATSDQIAFTGFESKSNGYWMLQRGETTEALNINLSMTNPSKSFSTNSTQTVNYTYSMTKTVGPSPELHFVSAGGPSYVHYLSQPSGNGSLSLPSGDWEVSVVWYPNVSAVNASMTLTEYIRGQLVYSADHATGNRSLEFQPLNYIERLLTNVGKYTLTYSYKGGEVNTALTSGSIISSSDVDQLNNWKLKILELDITQPNTTVTINGTGLIDELRLHPFGKQMTTVAYRPGSVTSTTDPNNVTTFYEYDVLGRLILLKDKQKDVVKGFQYNYRQ
jgi:hypothetical protein